MKSFICLLLFQFFVCLALCQIKPSISDTITNVIQGLPEYKAVQRNADSIQLASHSIDGKYNAGVSVAIEYKDNGKIANKIANVEITEQFDK